MSMSLEVSPRARTALWIFALSIAILLSFVLHSFIGTFVFSVFFYYAVRPLHRQIDRVVPWEGVSAALSITLFVLPVLALLLYTSIAAVSEFATLSSDLTTTLLSYAQTDSTTAVADLLQDPRNFDKSDLSILTDALGVTVSYLGVLGTVFLNLIVMLVSTYYLLRDDKRLSEWFHTTFIDEYPSARRFIMSVDNDLHHIFFGNILNAVVTGLIAASMFNALQYISPPGIELPAPTIVGLIAGMFSLIPVFGVKIVYLFATGWVGGQVWAAKSPELAWFPILVLILSFVLVDFIPDMLIRPYITGRTLHIGLVMIVYIIGPMIFGWFGLFLGPLLLVIAVHFIKILLPELLDADGGWKASVDPPYSD